jgi:hypothetical protein
MWGGGIGIIERKIQIPREKCLDRYDIDSFLINKFRETIKDLAEKIEGCRFITSCPNCISREENKTVWSLDFIIEFELTNEDEEKITDQNYSEEKMDEETTQNKPD